MGHRRCGGPVRPAARGLPYGRGVEFDEVVNDVVRAIEVVGIGVLVIGAVVAFLTAGRSLLRRPTTTAGRTYDDLRRNLARVILLGLEVLILADIIRTIVVEQTPQSVAVLGVVVLIRIVLSWSLQVEIEGAWPWQARARGRDVNRDGG